jgi:hypothetical protein
VTRRHGALRGRFLVAYVVLGLLAGAAVAGAFVLFTQTERNANLSWADWHPVGDEATYGQQIADHVARRYRLPSGDQVAGVVPGPPTFQTPEAYLQVRAVLIQSLNPSATPDVRSLPTEDSYMYLFCGVGAGCTVPGTNTEERHRLLRREALELALYSFKYLDGVETVIALLPSPANPAQAPNALFYEKDDLEEVLDRPLAETIERPETPTLKEVPELETVRVDRLTLPFVFEYKYEALPNNTAGLILAPVQPAG